MGYGDCMSDRVTQGRMQPGIEVVHREAGGRASSGAERLLLTWAVAVTPELLAHCAPKAAGLVLARRLVISLCTTAKLDFARCGPAGGPVGGQLSRGARWQVWRALSWRAAAAAVPTYEQQPEVGA